MEIFSGLKREIHRSQKTMVSCHPEECGDTTGVFGILGNPSGNAVDEANLSYIKLPFL